MEYCSTYRNSSNKEVMGQHHSMDERVEENDLTLTPSVLIAMEMDSDLNLTDTESELDDADEFINKHFLDDPTATLGTTNGNDDSNTVPKMLFDTSKELIQVPFENSFNDTCIENYINPFNDMQYLQSPSVQFNNSTTIIPPHYFLPSDNIVDNDSEFSIPPTNLPSHQTMNINDEDTLTTTQSDAAESPEEAILNMSQDDIIKLIACIPSLHSKCSELHAKFTSLETKCNSLESSNADLTSKCASLELKYNDLQHENTALKHKLTAHCTSSDKRFNKSEQYSMRNSLLAHRLLNVPTGLRGAEFSKYVADQLSELMPHLSITQTDIDTSHFLYNEHVGGKYYPVVIIKFICRDLRNAIFDWDRNGNLEATGVHFSEHLTHTNRKLFEDAKRAYHQDAWTYQCKIYANVNGRKQQIVERSDLPPRSGNNSGPARNSTANSYAAAAGNPNHRPPPRYKPPFKKRHRKKQFTRSNNAQNKVSSSHASNKYSSRGPPHHYPTRFNYSNRSQSTYQYQNIPIQSRNQMVNLHDNQIQHAQRDGSNPSVNNVPLGHFRQNVGVHIPKPSHFVQTANHSNKNLPSLNLQMPNTHSSSSSNYYCNDQYFNIPAQQVNHQRLQYSNHYVPNTSNS